MFQEDQYERDVKMQVPTPPPPPSGVTPAATRVHSLFNSISFCRSTNFSDSSLLGNLLTGTTNGSRSRRRLCNFLRHFCSSAWTLRTNLLWVSRSEF
jgi:hypothetical protein